MKKTSNILSISTILFCLLWASVYGQNQEKEKTYHQSFSASGFSKLDIIHQRGTLFLQPSSDAEIHVQLVVRITGKQLEDINTVLEAIKIESENNGPVLKIKSAAQITSWNETLGQSKIKLNSGAIAYGIKDLEMILTVSVPSLDHVSLKNKYEKIEVASNYSGNLEIDLYSGELSTKNVDGLLVINSKYSTLNFGDFKRGVFDLYECKSNGGSGSDIQIKSKYSRVQLKNCGKLDLDAYEDNYTINDIAEISTISDKYSQFYLGNVGDMKLNLYESELEVKSGRSLAVECKYGTIRSEKITTLELAESYETDFRIGTLDELLARNDKYGSFDINVLNRRFILNGYESSVDVEKVASSVSEITVESKYDKMHFGLSPDVIAYSLDAEMKYGNLSFQESNFKQIDRQEKGDELKIKAGTTNPNVKTKVFIRSYETDFTLR